MKLRLTADCPNCRHQHHIEEELKNLILMPAIGLITCENESCGSDFSYEASVTLQPEVVTSNLPGLLITNPDGSFLSFPL